MVIVILLISVVFPLFKKEDNQKPSYTTTDSIDVNIDTDDDDEKIDWSNYQDKDYEISKSITITEGGIYNLTGTIASGLITINTLDNVKLNLNNVSIINTKGPAIYVENASDVVINLVEGSDNYLEDGHTYETDDIGTIFSHDDITFEGTGTLEVVSNLEDAIVSKDDLKIISGTYKITSMDDGIRGKDSVYIQNGEFTIASGGDGIKSTNDTETDKGYVLIENGKFTIDAQLDGIDSQTKLLIQNGKFDITTSGGSLSSSNERWTYSSNSESSKGIKSGDNLVIENGTFNFNTKDDAIHCNNYVGIKKGTLNISSGDDGIHADKELIIDGGNINITKSYEGLESAKITINGGNISLISTDDGINVAGGNDSSALGRPGQNNYSKDTDNVLTINDGKIYVNSIGDGIDVNGSAYLNGGNILVDGPTNSGNGSLDYDRVFEVNGATLLAGGSSGMLQNCSSSSTTYNITINLNSNYSSEDIITIIDNSNNEVISYKSNKNYSSLIVATPKLKKGETYTININNLEYKTFTISNITTTIGNTSTQMHGGRGPR